MPEKASSHRRTTRLLSRRQFVRGSTTAAVTAAAAPALIIPGRAGAERKKLRILQWTHFVPGFDDWFNNQYIKAWGEANDTDVIVDNVGMTSIPGRAQAQINAGRGHDLVLFMRPPSVLEDFVLNLKDVHEECARRYGNPIELATRSTFNPKTGKYFAFSDSYAPDPINYRKDLWDDVGVRPDSWDEIREGGRLIRRKHGIPIGLGLAPELDSNMALRSLLASFGASVQDAEGRPALRSPQTLEALGFVKALYKEAMTDEVFAWDPSSNNRLLLSGRGSLTLNAISITRTGENQKIPIASDIALAPVAKGPVRRIGLYHLVNCYTIWNFAQNIDGAKQFLVDYVGNFRAAFLASELYNFPCYQGTVPDLQALLQNDPKSTPPGKYAIFTKVADWITNVGYPGYANAAIDELFSSWTISKMFAQAARGKMSPDQALAAADSEVQAVFAKWRELGKV